MRLNLDFLNSLLWTEGEDLRVSEYRVQGLGPYVLIQSPKGDKRLLPPNWEVVGKLEKDLMLRFMDESELKDFLTEFAAALLE